MYLAGSPMTNIPPTLTIVAIVGEYETRAAPVPSTARTWSPKLSSQPDGRMKLRVRSMWTTFAWTSTPGITPCGVAKKSRLSWNVAPTSTTRPRNGLSVAISTLGSASAATTFAGKVRRLFAWPAERGGDRARAEPAEAGDDRERERRLEPRLGPRHDERRVADKAVL